MHIILFFSYEMSKKGQCTKTEGFPDGSVVKDLPANSGDPGSFPGLGWSPGEGNGNCSSILAWEIPWTEEPGGLVHGVPKEWDTI